MVANNPQRYPMDDITMKLVVHGIAKVPVQGGKIHGMPIPEGYARVMVDQVEKGWEDLDLEIPGGDGE